MKWEKRDINGLLISKDLVEPFEYTLYVRLKGRIPDKRWIPVSILHDIAWLFMSDPSSILAETKSELKSTQLKNVGTRISDKLSSNEWSKYRMPEGERYKEFHGVEFIRMYRAKRNKIIKVLTKVEDTLLLGRFSVECEYDVLKIIQWLSEWKEKTSIYQMERKNFIKYTKALMDYSEKDKLFNMHFGDEYNEEDKKAFSSALQDMYTYVKLELPKYLSITMLKGKHNEVILEANI